MRLKHIAFTFILILGVFILLFSIGEICFRLTAAPNPLADTTQKDSDILFLKNLTLIKTSSVEGEFEYTSHTNNHGYRGRDFATAKTPNQIRILAVGDSFTFGVGANDHETIPAIIEQKLKDSGTNAEVINAGIGHASPIHHYVNLRNIHLQYKPDLVLLLFDLTDLWDDWHSELTAVYDTNGEIIRFDPTFINGKRSWWLTAMKYSHFCEWIDRKIVRTFKKIQQLGFKRYAQAVIEGKRAKALIIQNKDTKNDSLIEYDGLLMLRGREKKDLIDKHWPRTAGYIVKIKELLNREQIPMILIMYPHGIYVGKQQWAKGRATWGFEANQLYTDYYPFELVESFAQDENIPFINTLSDFPKTDETKFFYDYDGHMTPAGYAVVANSIVANPSFKEIVDRLIANK